MKSKTIFLILFLYLGFYQLCVSQINNQTVQVLIRGTITDKFDNSPMQVEIRFEEPSGKFFKITSNSLTGKFEQILTANTQYKIRLTGIYIFPTEFVLTTPNVNKYTEFEQNYQAIRLDVGRTVTVLDLFQEGKPDFVQNIDNLIEDLNVKMRFNRNVKIKLEILGIDSKSNFSKTIEKKIKKKTMTEHTFNKAGYEDLINKRYKILNEYKDKISFINRLSLTVNFDTETTDSMFNDCPKCDTRIIVTEFDPTLK